MLRCGQMLIANTILNLHLGRSKFCQGFLSVRTFIHCMTALLIDWRWQSGHGHSNFIYMKILSLIADNKDATYSVQQIGMCSIPSVVLLERCPSLSRYLLWFHVAWTGESEGKPVGAWFGPNTVAQVLKKLALYDSWSNLVVHVAMDNMVVLEDIYKRCESVAPRTGQSTSHCLLNITLPAHP